MVPLIIVLLVAGLFATIGVMRALRWWLERRPPPPSGDFSLEEVEEMRARGDLNEAEYQRVRAGVLARRSAAPPPKGPRGFDVLPPKGDGGA